MSTIITTCSFCKESHIYIDKMFVKPDYIIWCDNCVAKHAPALNKLGVDYTLSRGYNVWGKEDNVAKLRSIMSQYIEEQADAPAQIAIEEKTICNRIYYGINCECDNCIEYNKKIEAKYGKIDPFGYNL